MSSDRPDHRDFGVSAAKARELRRRMHAVGLEEAALTEKFAHGGGRGGQKVNKTAYVCQLTHSASGRVVSSAESRSRGLNRYLARRRLVELLEAERLGETAPLAVAAARERKQKARRRRRAAARDRAPHPASPDPHRDPDPEVRG